MSGARVTTKQGRSGRGRRDAPVVRRSIQRQSTLEATRSCLYRQQKSAGARCCSRRVTRGSAPFSTPSAAPMMKWTA